MRSLVAEFPNDNPALHAGTTWMSEEVCGEAQPHFSIPPPPPVSAVEIVAHPPEETLDPHPEDDGSDIEIVERFEDFELSEHLLELVPPPLESGPMPLETLAAMAGAIAREHERLERAQEAQQPAEAEAAPEPPPPLHSDVVPSDAYCTLLRAMEEVAREGGATLPADFAASLEGSDAVARAWAAILRGESEDFSVCGASPLDEWAAGVLAAKAGAPSKAAAFRRELRARGVAAFGLIDAA